MHFPYTVVRLDNGFLTVFSKPLWGKLRVMAGFKLRQDALDYADAKNSKGRSR